MRNGFGGWDLVQVLKNRWIYGFGFMIVEAPHFVFLFSIVLNIKLKMLDLWYFYDFGVSKKQCFWWREFMILKNKFFLKKLVTPSSKTSRFPISIRKFSPPSGAILISSDRLPNECLRFLIFVAISNNNFRTYFPVGKHKLSTDLDHQYWFNGRWSVPMK